MKPISLFLWSAAITVLWANTVLAQTYPTRPPRLVVPYVAGGVADFMARVTAEGVQELLGTQIVIDKVDDPVHGAPSVALVVSAWSGHTATGPWTLGERIWLRNTMAYKETDTANCGGSAAYRGMYQWMVGHTLLFKNVDGWQYHP